MVYDELEHGISMLGPGIMSRRVHVAACQLKLS